MSKGRGGGLNSRGRGTVFLAAFAALAVGLLTMVDGASAHLFYPYQYESYFDGHDSTGGAFTQYMNSMTIDQENGRVYVMYQHGPKGEAEISQFDQSGQAVGFPALSGKSTIQNTGGSATNIGGYAGGSLEWDWTPFHGGLYADATGFTEVGKTPGLRAYNLDGSLRWGPIAGTNLSNDITPAVPDGSILYSAPYARLQASNGGAASLPAGTSIFGDWKVELGDDGYYYFSRNQSETGAEEQGLYKGTPHPTCDRYNCEVVQRFSYAGAPNDLVIDRSTDDIYSIEPPYDKITEYGNDGHPIQTFGLPEGAFGGLDEARGIAVNEATKDVYVTSLTPSPRVDVFHPSSPVTVPDVSTANPSHPDSSSAVLRGVVNPDGTPTTDCKFEWGTTTQYTTTLGTEGVPCEQGNVLSGSTEQDVTLKVEGLTLGAQYHYRVAARNANGHWTYSGDRVFEGSTAPTADGVIVDQVNTDGARLTSQISPHGGTVSYHFEVGREDCASHPCESIPVPDGQLQSRLKAESESATIRGLEPDTTYHVRLVAESGAGVASPSSVFHTFASPPKEDPCENAQVRQQTGAYLLPDCRAYELVSARNAGGYDVESTLNPGQHPLLAYPSAKDRVLYGLHFGSVPGIAGSPPNYGVDPYVAERGERGWTTRYVGLPADGMADQDAYGSPLLEADEHLDEFAFGGAGICSPCFQGLGANLPVRRDGKPAEAGMAGSLPAGETEPSGYVGRYLSEDGSHLVFGSTAKFEPTGGAGELTIYERNLAAATTEVVSTDDAGTTISGPGTAALDVSSNGSRVVVGKLVSTDAAGNAHYHLYLHSAGDPDAADLTPGGSAEFSGMTSDGSRVFMTTTDSLLPEDTDSSADIYEAKIDGSGQAHLRLVSTTSGGSPSNSDACTPAGYPATWNSPAGDGMCGAVAFAGGGGVAAANGTFYFVSPELLDGGEGEPDQPNLYVVKPDDTPHFVGTVDSSLVEPGPPAARHPLANANFASVREAEALAVDESNGDVYAVDQGEGKVVRFDSSGQPKNFTAGPDAGSNALTGFFFPEFASGVAVDNSSESPLEGDLYVAGVGVTIWSQTGERLGQLTGSTNHNGSIGFACGVSVDQMGNVYVSDYFGYVWKYSPSSPSGELTDADYTVTGIQTSGMTPCASASDGSGHLYVDNYSDGPLKRFSTASFTSGVPSGQTGQELSAVGRALGSDEVRHEVFASEGSQLAVYDAQGNQISTISGTGAFTGARGVAGRGTDGHVFVSAKSAGKIIEYGYELPPYRPIADPAVVHGVNRAYQHSYGDIQVGRDGHYAVFDSVMPLTGYQNLGHSEIFRYDTAQEQLACPSCASTLAPAKGDAFLSDVGLNLASDGHVFYTSPEGLVLSDTNEKLDAYEWDEGKIGILSTGQGLDDSALLSVSEDGTDAFFFTRDTLVPYDENGGAVKIYDARVDGGFLQLPNPQPCAASDECHGAGTQAPPPPNVNSLEGAGGSGYGPPPASSRCARKQVLRHGKCVKRPHRRHHRKRGPRNHG